MRNSNNKRLSPTAAMIIFVCVMIIFTISILYVNSGKKPATKESIIPVMNQPIAESAPATQQEQKKTLPSTYTDATYGFTMNYEEPFTLTRGDASTQGVRLDFAMKQWKASVIVGPAKTDTELIRSSYEIGTEDDITIDGNPAVKIIGTSLKSNEITYLYLITRGDRIIAVYSTSANIQPIAEKMTFAK